MTELGHAVEVVRAYEGQSCDLLIALHARKCARSVARYRERSASAPMVVALAGTDIYQELEAPEVQTSMKLADRLVALQPRALAMLSPELREKVEVIYQSARPPSGLRSKPRDRFQVCLLAHLREVKDPLRIAQAVRLLPEASRIQAVHAGEALDHELAARARRESASNPRYRWLGPLSRPEATRLLAESHLVALTSFFEGGANVVSEALAAEVPLVASRIEGTLGILGEHYPGYFGAGDAGELAKVLDRAEQEPSFYRSLEEACSLVAPLVSREREGGAWQALLDRMVK
jgi:putative glycosyltransferase (TIGR04348 family)